MASVPRTVRHSRSAASRSDDELLADLANVVAQAANAVRLADARQSKGTANKSVSRAIYSSAYALGFSLSWPVCFLGALLPDSAAKRGFQDGAAAAIVAAKRRRKGGVSS